MKLGCHVGFFFSLITYLAEGKRCISFLKMALGTQGPCSVAERMLGIHKVLS